MALYPGSDSWFQSASFYSIQDQPYHLQSQDISPELLRYLELGGTPILRGLSPNSVRSSSEPQVLINPTSFLCSPALQVVAASCNSYFFVTSVLPFCFCWNTFNQFPMSNLLCWKPYTAFYFFWLAPGVLPALSIPYSQPDPWAKS